MEKFKKIDKEFQLTDNSVNCYGFRLLTEGYQQNLYAKNPIGYYMHDRNSGVVLKWVDFRTENDAVYAKPVINLSHPRGQQTIDEIENGFLNAASVGHLIVMECTDDPAHKLPDQKGPTVTKWYNREASLVDIPGNFNSLKLYDAEENPLNLSDFTNNTTTKKIDMTKVVLSATSLAALNLKAEADQTAIDTAIADLAAKAVKADALEAEKVTLVADKQKAEDEKKVAEDALAAIQKTTVTEKVEAILADALAAGQVTKESSDKLKVKFADDADGLKDLVSALPAYKSITGQINDKGSNDDKALAALAAKSYDELFESGELEILKSKDLAAFQAKHKEKYGKEYQV